MALTCQAYLRVDKVSTKLTSAGDRAATMAVFAFPPKNGLRMNVSLELRYGTTSSFFASPEAFLASA